MLYMADKNFITNLSLLFFYIWSLFDTTVSKNNTNKRKKEGTDKTDVHRYTVVAHINVSHEQIG